MAGQASTRCMLGLSLCLSELFNRGTCLCVLRRSP